jgi:hypothetical protein
MSPEVELKPCYGCWHLFDLLASVRWGDKFGYLCVDCTFDYRRLRQRPESKHLYWRPVRDD